MDQPQQIHIYMHGSLHNDMSEHIWGESDE